MTAPTGALAYSVGQAAHELGVSLGTIRRWTDLGHLKCYRTPGGQRRISRADLDRFLADTRHAENVTHPAEWQCPICHGFFARSAPHACWYRA